MGNDPVGHVGHEVYRRHIAHIDGPPVPRGQKQPRDFCGCRQALPRHQPDLVAPVTDAPCIHRAVGRLHLARQLLQRHAIQRHAFGIGRDADRLVRLAHDIGQAHILDLRQIGPQFARQPRQVIGADLGPFSGRQGQRHDRHIIDAPPDDQRLGNTNGDAVHIGPHLFMHAQDRRVRGGAHVEPCSDHRAVIHGLRIDMLDVVDRLDDGLHRFGHQPHRILGLQPRCLHQDIHHRHRNLRLFLARDNHQRDQTHGQRRQHDQRGQGRADETLGQVPRDAQRLGFVAHFTTTVSPSVRPDRTSRMTVPSCSCRWPNMTARSP